MLRQQAASLLRLNWTWPFDSVGHIRNKDRGALCFFMCVQLGPPCCCPLWCVRVLKPVHTQGRRQQVEVIQEMSRIPRTVHTALCTSLFAYVLRGVCDRWRISGGGGGIWFHIVSVPLLEWVSACWLRCFGDI